MDAEQQHRAHHSEATVASSFECYLVAAAV